MFALSFLPLSYSNTQQTNGIQSNIILNVLQDDNIILNIKKIVNLELRIEKDKIIIL